MLGLEFSFVFVFVWMLVDGYCYVRCWIYGFAYLNEYWNFMVLDLIFGVTAQEQSVWKECHGTGWDSKQLEWAILLINGSQIRGHVWDVWTSVDCCIGEFAV